MIILQCSNVQSWVIENGARWSHSPSPLTMDDLLRSWDLGDDVVNAFNGKCRNVVLF